jgi:hypothetical protein
LHLYPFPAENSHPLCMPSQFVKVQMTARRWILGAPTRPIRSTSAPTIASPRWLRSAARRRAPSRHCPSM